METLEQVNENFNVKKPKKKGLMITGIIAAVVVVALVLLYFLVLTSPKFIFGKTIDKLLAVETESYETVKIDTKIKADVELEDATYQAQLAEIEKYTLKAGVQMNAEEKQEIVDLGLEYDNQAVIDAQVYYNDGEMYAYFEGLFDKYIEIDMDEETKAQLDELFETVTSEENIKNSEKAIKIVRDELKSQIKENGEFEKKKDTIEIGEDEVKATKSTLTLSEKQLWKVATNMLSNLAENEEFVKCFEDETIEDDLKELAELMDENKTEGKGNIKISLYTKGLLNNKLVAVNAQLYVPEEEVTVVTTVVKEDEGIYSYSVSGKTDGIKIDFANGKIEIEKDKDSKTEQSGKAIITTEIIELGSAKLEIDYVVEYNQGIDKIDTSNSVNMNNLTDSDMEAIMSKLMERPLIKDLLEDQMSGLGEENIGNIVVETPTVENPIINNDSEIGTETTTTTSQNEVKDEYYGYSVKYSVPTGFVYSQYSYDDMKFYDLENADYSYIDATVSLEWSTETEYIQEDINWDYEYYSEETNYTNVKLSEVKTIAVGDKTFKYVILSYDTDYGTKCQDAYVWYVLDSEYMFTIELEATDTAITEEIIKGFLNISVTELN